MRSRRGRESMEGGVEGKLVSGGSEKRGTGSCCRRALAAKKRRRKVNKRRLHCRWAHACATVCAALALEMHKEGAGSVEARTKSAGVFFHKTTQE